MQLLLLDEPEVSWVEVESVPKPSVSHAFNKKTESREIKTPRVPHTVSTPSHCLINNLRELYCCFIVTVNRFAAQMATN